MSDADTQPAHALRALRPALEALAVLVVSVLLSFTALNVSGLTLSEGHRAIPAWTMADTGDWWVPRLFERVYLRKPPGVPWGIGALSLLFGQTELAARSLSAAAMTLLALGSWWFARRWFGHSAALWAGLLQATLPLWTPVARSCEIEAVHVCATFFAACMVLDGLLLKVRPGRAVFRGLALTLAVFALGISKGPAGAPVVAAALVVGFWMRPRAGSTSSAGMISVFFGLLAGTIAVAAALLKVKASAGDLTAAVTQSPGEFLWDTSKLGLIASVIPVALASGLPGTLTLFTPWLTSNTSAAVLRARALTLTCLLALVVYNAVGVGNPRYAMPALVLPSVLWGFALGPALAHVSWSRWLALGHPAVLAVILFAAGGFNLVRSEQSRLRNDGRAAGEAIAAAATTLGAPTVIVRASDLVEARPDVLWYARRAGHALGIELIPVWTPAEDWSKPDPRGPTLLALRDDPESQEASVVRVKLGNLSGEPIASVRAAKYAFVLCPAAEPAPPPLGR